MATPSGQMTVTPTRELEQYVRDKVREGDFATPSEYIRHLVRDRYLAERDHVAKLKDLDNALARGIADADAGRVVPVTEAFAHIRAQLADDEIGPRGGESCPDRPSDWESAIDHPLYPSGQPQSSQDIHRRT